MKNLQSARTSCGMCFLCHGHSCLFRSTHQRARRSRTPTCQIILGPSRTSFYPAPFIHSFACTALRWVNPCKAAVGACKAIMVPFSTAFIVCSSLAFSSCLYKLNGTSLCSDVKRERLSRQWMQFASVSRTWWLVRTWERRR